MKSVQEAAREWAVLRALLGDIEMVMAKADLGIARRFASLAGETGERMYPQLRRSFEETAQVICEVLGIDELLQNELWLARAIRLRNPYIDPMSLRPPGDAAHERVGNPAHYRALPPLLWSLAMHGPGAHLLAAIAGRAAYRLAPGVVVAAGTLPGALGPALMRLRTEIAPLDAIARWPGMDRDRAVRLLNGAYLSGSLMVLRSHEGARSGGTGLRALKRWWGDSRA